jgi:hypothetical protein
MDTFSQTIGAWQTFYLLTGTAATTLIGLLFVSEQGCAKQVTPARQIRLARRWVWIYACLYSSLASNNWELKIGNYQHA